MHSNFPLVSVCMPAFNAGSFISQAIDSVIDQTYPNIELIVVNDGSIDNTAEILESYTGRGVRVFHQGNKGQCAAANTAFSHSRGEYIKFFDADDILSKNFITAQMDRLGGQPDSIASAAWGRFLQDDLSTFAPQHEEVYQDMAPMDWLVTSLKKGPNMMQCGLWLIPRSVLHCSGLWDERLSLINDFDFFIRVILASKAVLYAPDAILYYRSGLEQSLSARKSGNALESAYLSTKLGVEAILKYEDSPRTRKICADAFQLWKYQFYPHHLNLYKQAEAQVTRLGGSDYAYAQAGVTGLMVKIIGWKKTKQLKHFINK